MQFASLNEFLMMGGHGLYVWLAYGLSAAIIALNLIQPMLRRHRLIKAQQQVLRRERQTHKKSSQQRETACTQRERSD